MYIENEVYHTCIHFLYNKSLAQGHFHLVHAHSTQKHHICQKSTNSLFIVYLPRWLHFCVLSLQDRLNSAGSLSLDYLNFHSLSLCCCSAFAFLNLQSEQNVMPPLLKTCPSARSGIEYEFVKIEDGSLHFKNDKSYNSLETTCVAIKFWVMIN